MRSVGEWTRAGGAPELGTDFEVYSEHESMMQTENLSNILVFSTWWTPREPFLIFPVVRALDTPRAQIIASWLHPPPRPMTKLLCAEAWPLGCC